MVEHIALDSEVQFFFRRHWTRFLGIILFGIFIGLLLMIVLFGLYGLIAALQVDILRPFFVFFTLITVLIYLHVFFLQIISYYFNTVIVTDTRIIIARKSVFLKNDSDAIDLTKIQDITAESRGILRNYLHFGNLIITLSANIPPVVIDCVPRPHYYLEKSNRAKRHHILSRQERRLRDDEGSVRNQREEYLQDIRNL